MTVAHTGRERFYPPMIIRSRAYIFSYIVIGNEGWNQKINNTRSLWQLSRSTRRQQKETTNKSNNEQQMKRKE